MSFDKREKQRQMVATVLQNTCQQTLAAVNVFNFDVHTMALQACAEARQYMLTLQSTFL